MDTIVEIDKLEIAKWLINLEDKSTLEKVARIMKESNKPKYDAAYEATLSDKEKVVYWQEVGISGEEFFNNVIEHIRAWPWKK
ncbi:hypothetical protein A9P82_01190 [Arachidicoccus ginsenosidimutans]|uniref:hypothetical protein n=1 Tax=Arachidicoccus sp. BS20 TaxID=1850526 RepID=UPI0007F16432|nr:hypothetical protein [Arachidicoccus sp. BS20]ANI88055.1 hypothetical protein A9P82_01190 [Arachidicoccus sp. BS20]